MPREESRQRIGNGALTFFEEVGYDAAAFFISIVDGPDLWQFVLAKALASVDSELRSLLQEAMRLVLVDYIQRGARTAD